MNVDCLNGIFFTDITDHFPVFTISFKNSVSEKQNTHKTRSCTDLNISEFNKKMKSLDWQPVMSCFDTQTTYSMFHNIYAGYYDQYFPIRKVNSVYKNRKKWLSLGLKKSIRTKNK